MNGQSNTNSAQEGFIPSYLNKNLTDKDILYIDEVENAIDSLETAFQFLHRRDNLKWKWIAISLDHPLYSFCIATLVCGNPTNVLENRPDEDKGRVCKIGDVWKKSKIETTKHPAYKIQWEFTNEEPPEIDLEKTMVENLQKRKENKLIGFWTALARVQDPTYWMGTYIHSQAVTTSESQLESIWWLHMAVRNQLIHFSPMSFYIPISAIKAACKDVLDVIEFLAFKSNQILYIREEMSQERIAKAIKGLRQSL